VATAALAGEVAVLLIPLLADGAIVASDQALALPGFEAIALPDSVPPRRYFLWRVRKQP
jgi:hypothetical protein